MNAWEKFKETRSTLSQQQTRLHLEQMKIEESIQSIELPMDGWTLNLKDGVYSYMPWPETKICHGYIRVDFVAYGSAVFLATKKVKGKVWPHAKEQQCYRFHKLYEAMLWVEEEC